MVINVFATQSVILVLLGPHGYCFDHLLLANVNHFFQHFLGQAKEEAPLTSPILEHPRDLSYWPRVLELQVAKPRRPSLVISDAIANAVIS